MTNTQPVIKLTPGQVEHVVRSTQAQGPDIMTMLRSALAGRAPGPVAVPDMYDPRLSQSLMRGLSLLTCYDSFNTPMGIIQMAETLDMSPSTAHRYATTLAAPGLLDHDSKRKYRLRDV
jgi:hypothetical protein